MYSFHGAHPDIDRVDLCIEQIGGGLETVMAHLRQSASQIGRVMGRTYRR